MNEIDVMVNIPLMERIWSVYPVSFISIIGGAFGWLLCYPVARSDLKYGSRRIDRLYDIYIKLIEQKPEM